MPIRMSKLLPIAAALSMTACFPGRVVVKVNGAWATSFIRVTPSAGKFGFDLDGINSMTNDPNTCNKIDAQLTSELGALSTGVGAVGGIDNMLPDLSDALTTHNVPSFADALADTLRTYRASILVRIDGITDPNAETEEQVSITMTLALPDFAAPCTAAENRPFLVWDRSAQQKTTSVTAQGTIKNHKVDVTFGAETAIWLPVRIPSNNRVVDLALRGVRFQAYLPNVYSGMPSFNLGAKISGADLSRTLRDDLGLSPTDANMIVTNLIDVANSGRCDRTDDVATSGYVSIGFSGATDLAVIRPNTATEPVPGTCASGP